MNYFSMFSGCGGTEVAIQRGQPTWKCVGVSEIEKNACAVLKYRFPEVKNYGNAETINWKEVPYFDLLVGGFPCQAFSIAGERRGFDDTRGMLFFEMVRAIRDKRPRYILIENVEGLISDDNGKTLDVVFSTLDECGYDISWQLVNAVYKVPQSRERIYIVCNARNEPRPQVFPLGTGSKADSFEDQRQEGEFVNYIDRNYNKGIDNHGQRTAIVQSVGDSGLKELTFGLSDAQRIYDSSGVARTLKGLGGGQGAKTGLYRVLQHSRDEKGAVTYNKRDVAGTLKQPSGNQQNFISVQPILTPNREEKRQNGRRVKEDGEEMFTLTSQDQHGVMIDGTRIRRLTPLEGERLMSWTDGWTQFGDFGDGKIKELSDTARYRLIGNGVVSDVIADIVRNWYIQREANTDQSMTLSNLEDF